MAAMPPAGPTLLRLQCGTCSKLINVQVAYLEGLLRDKRYSCPYCASKQSIHVQPEQEVALRAQAQHYLRAVALASAVRGQGGTGPVPPGLPPRAGGGAPFPLPPGLPPAQMAHLAAAMARYQQAKRPSGMGPGPPATQAQALLDQFAPKPEERSPDDEDDGEEGEVADTFLDYAPSKLPYGEPHPDAVVETASLAAVEPPDVTYELAAHASLVGRRVLSALQLEAVVYACQRHEQRLPDGARGGFFIGDGAGVGKGRTVAGLVAENWARGRRRHLWVSIASDLRLDARRDLDDAGAPDVPLHALNKLPYGRLAGAKIGVTEGVIFLTYASLIASSDRGPSRYKQLVEWCGPEFEGLIVFDESHKAKNLVPEAGSRSTQVGLRVRDIQAALPGARIVYCSATGASEPRNMGYMVRLGLWGEGSAAFRDFSRFLDAVGGKSSGGGMASLELVAMDMKAQGMYVCRTLSFAGAEFETVEAPLEAPVAGQYAAAARMWNELFREFMYAEEQAEAAAAAAEAPPPPPAAGAAGGGESGAPSGATTAGTSGRRRRGGGGGGIGSMTWRAFWASHQRFFRHMCMAAKVPAAVRMSVAALAEGKCVVIGLQSTGESRTADVVAERGEELDDFVSGPKELLLRLVEDYYPMPPEPEDSDDSDDEEDSDSEEEVAPAPSRRALATEAAAAAAAVAAAEARAATGRSSKAKPVRYKEFRSDEDIGDSDRSSSSSSDDDSDNGSGSGSAESAGTVPGSGEAAQEAEDDGDAASSGADSGSGQERGGRGRDGRRRGAPSEPSLDSEARAAAALAAEMQQLRREQLLAARAAAQARKDRVKAAVAAMELPANPLDDLIDRLGGPAAVAEMTGRKGRLVRSASAATVRYEPRNASGVGAGATLEMINVHERGLFLDGTKLVAVISEAASAGISLHADRRVRNRRRRVHLTLELPWSADKAIQQFGRSHRANQESGPQYRLVFTPLGGEKRFAAAVARRLESLGALTQGDRRAGPSLAAFNYESSWGQKALREMYATVLGERRVPLAVPPACRLPEAGGPPPAPGAPPPPTLERFMGRARAHLLNAGIVRHNRNVTSSLHLNAFLESPDGAPPGVGTIEERDRADVPRFLNRLLGMAPAAQEEVFDFYQATLDAMMQRARRDGSLDEGIVDLRAHSVTLGGPPRALHTDPLTGASTLLYTILTDRGLPWEAARDLLAEHEAKAALEAAAAPAAVMASVPLAGQQQQQQEEEEEEEPKEEGDGGAEGGGADAPAAAAAAAATPPDSKAAGKRGRRAAAAGGGSKRARRSASAAPEGSAEEIDLTLDEVASPAAAAAAAPAGWESGFYRARQDGVGGRVHVLLALRVPAPASSPATFTIHRPPTGRSRQPLPLHDLKARYLPLSEGACRPLWEKAHAAAGTPGKDGRPGLRRRTHHILGGAVLRSWGAVQRALVRHVSAKERRMRVLRIATTGENSQRLVGMLVPEPAVADVVAELTKEAAEAEAAEAEAEGGGI